MSDWVSFERAYFEKAEPHFHSNINYINCIYLYEFLVCLMQPSAL